MTLSEWTPRKDTGIKILRAVQSQGLGKDAGVVAIMVVMVESSMQVLNYGDTPTSTSRGLYQQKAPWGPLELRMDITQSTLMFLNGGWSAGTYGLTHYPWRTWQPWIAAERVQGSAYGDGRNYQARYADAVEFVAAYWPAPVSTWVLTGSQYFGPLTGPADSISGMYATDTDAQRAAIKKIQGVVGVPLNGHFDAVTIAAVRKWEAAHNRPVDGIVTKNTWGAMGI